MSNKGQYNYTKLVAEKHFNHLRVSRTNCSNLLFDPGIEYSYKPSYTETLASLGIHHDSDRNVCTKHIRIDINISYQIVNFSQVILLNTLGSTL
ncbi:MAG: hypothetical protein AB4080_01705 [Trichodesmium sp.]